MNMLDFLEGFFDFKGARGCFWVVLHIGLLIYAVVCLAVGIHTLFATLILIEEVLDVAVYAVYYLVIERKKYYREDSFWLRKDDADSKNEDD